MAERREFEDDIVELVSAASEALGLREATPPSASRYDAVLVLGGLIRGCIARTRYAAELFASGLRAQDLIALGAFRPLSAHELAIAHRLGLDASNEVDALREGVRIAFGSGLVEPPTVEERLDNEAPGRSWRKSIWATRNVEVAERVAVIAAPAVRDGAARANTAETYDYWLHEVAPPTTHRVLIITNPIYVPYQGCVAIRELGLRHGLDVEISGVSANAADFGDQTQAFGTQEYLQETLSSINAMVDLRAALADPAP